MMFILGISRKSVELTPTLSVTYMERGPVSSDKSTLLLIHGFGVSKEYFISLFRFLPRQMRVLALDLPGHGESGMKEKEDFSIRSFVQHVKQVSMGRNHMFNVWFTYVLIWSTIVCL